MISGYGLKNKEFPKRKVVKEQRYPKKSWSKFTSPMIEVINKYHFTPPTFKRGYRSGRNIIKGAEWILIDVDEAGSNVEEKLIEFKLEFIKSPSASASKKVTHKWHYFVKTLPLSKDADIARGQIRDFYDALKLENIDTTSIDPARYFAPCGAGAIFGTPEHKKRVKWCNKRIVHTKGIAWVPKDEADIDPVYTGTGTPVNIKSLDIVDSPEMDSTGDYEVLVMKETEKPKGGLTQHLSPNNKVWTKYGWTTLSSIASKLGEGETVSNLFGCPVHNMKHKNPKTIGYGYATRKGDTVFFNCGGDSCEYNTYYIRSKNGD